MPLRRFVGPSIVPLLALLAACGTEGAADSPSFTVRDSAGIEIVESTGPMWAEGRGWMLAPEPTLDIGVVDGAPEYQLSDVSGARRLSDSRIAVANGGSQEIRFYDGAGAYINAVGGKGGGPGEFQRVRWIQLLPGDSLVAFDAAQQRISVFPPEGDFVRAFTVDRAPDGGFASPAGALGDGSLVVRASPSGDGPPSGLLRRSDIFLHYSNEGKMLDTISVQLGSERYVQTGSENGIITSISIMVPLFGRTQMQSVNGDRVLLGGNDAYQLEVYTPEGDLERVVRRDQPPRPVTDAAVEASIEQRISSISDPADRKRTENALHEIPEPSSMPFYDATLLDDEGNIWVRGFQPAPAPASPQAWTVFDTDGRMLGDVSLPDRFTPMQIGNDFVLGVWKDDLDVEHVRMYALEKPA